ncbi:RNA exonuclease 1 homolog [Diachasmimorpha longicaudata]|uniref:RNA exonuclease 1 homolog n=1 Tax=Diachasmimorpha longicaudata TaxID=58733 RepID=UPI0030B909C5
MLPSTGYFKSINCPFYDSGSCDRPYCHFKHVRKDDISNPAPSILGYHTNHESQKAVESMERGERNKATSLQKATNPEMIQLLVSGAINKALADQGGTDSETASKGMVPTVVEGLTPALTPTIGKHSGVPQSITKPPCVYNPTPISELRKRHIAVPVYNPMRESKVSVKRKSTDDSTKPWFSALPESIKNDQKRINEITYKPTAIVHEDRGEGLNYIPTSKSDEGNSSDHSKRKEVYYPKCKKRREEYVPKKVKAPLQSVHDEMALDSFDPEFNLLDDIFIGNQKSEKSYESSSQDIYSIDGKFSDEEGRDATEITETMEVPKTEITNTEGTIVTDDLGQETNNKCDQKAEHNNIAFTNKADDISEETSLANEQRMKFNHKDESRRCSISSESSRHSETRKSREHSNKENSTEKKSTSSHKSKSSSSDKDKKSSHSRRDSKEHERSHSHRSSSSRRTDSKSRSKSTSHSSRDKSNESRSREDKSSISKENNHHKSSRHDKKKSSSSSRSKSNEKSSSKSSGRRSSSSSGKSKESKGICKSASNNEIDHSDHDSTTEVFDNYIGEELLQSSDSEHDVEKECLKIFQEYQVADTPKIMTTKQTIKADEVFEEVGKKRVAHPSAEHSVVRSAGPTQPLKKASNPQQTMYERWRMMREAVAEKASKQMNPVREINDEKIEVKSTTFCATKPTPCDPQVNGNGRVRIAHVPYAMSLALSKKKVVDATSKPVESKTVAQTTKGTPRIAHIPQTVPTLVRPEPLQVSTQKFAINVRQYYVNLMHDICVQIYTNGDDAAQRALREELACHERCKALTVYKNSCMLAAHRLRKEVDQNVPDGSAPSASGMLSHDAVLAGKTKGSWSVVKVKKAVTDFKGSALYCMLKKWIMTEIQLRDNGFPRVHPEGPKGRAKYYSTRTQPLISKVPNERICIRCGQTYMVDRRGISVTEQNCIYHWGRKFTVRGEGRYSCCQQYGSAGGCADAKNHVWDYVDYENQRGYVSTLPKDCSGEPEEQGVYALDCEMTYTTQGLELTRVTVINEDCQVVYETLVKPDNPIIDYNTRFSGITEDNMTGVTTSLLDVQATLLTMFSDHTILVGHSLESDFKALKLIHNTVVDTSTMFPHKNGPPHKRALRNLCSEYLRKIIQNDVGGHDSNEDAVACMELIHWKVKEEAKLQ